MYFFNIKLCMTSWHFTATHPKNIGNVCLSILFFVNVVLNLIFQFLAVLLLVYEGDSMDILDVSRVLESCFALCHGLLTLVSLYAKRTAIRDLLANSRGLGITDDIKDETLKASCDKILQNLRKLFMIYMSVASAAALMVFILRPLISKGKFLVLICYLPQGVPYVLVDILQVYVYMVTIHLPIISFDGIFLTMAILIQVQFKVLNNDMRTLFDDEADNRTDINKKIGNWVEQHNSLLQLVRQIDRVFSVPLLLYSGYVTVGMCFELYLILTQEQFNSGPYFVIVAVIFEFIFCYCVPAQILINEAEKINQNVWKSSWYKKPSSTIRTALTMILMTSQKTLSINAVIVPINLMTCLNTLKTMVSYYMILRTVGTED